jgi:hypothetical protein
MTHRQVPILSSHRIVVGAIVIAYLVLAGSQLNQLFVIDEMEFPRLAEAISETTKPVYYRGEETPQHSGTFHPPLYAYALGGWLALTGYSETTVRLFGVLLMLGTAALGSRTIQYLGLKSPWVRAAFLAVFLLHPYTIQSALLPDIDGTVLLFASTLLLHELARRLLRSPTDALRFVIGVGAVVALNLWAKLTSFPLFVVLVLALLVTQRVSRALLLAGSTLAVGIALFAASWAVVATLIGADFAYPFDFTIRSGLKGGFGETDIGGLLVRLLPVDSTRYWLGWVLPALLLWGIAVAARGWRTKPESRVMVVYGLWALGAYAMYSLLSGAPFGFPKYYIAAIPAAAMLSVVPLQRALEQFHGQRIAVSMGLTVALVAGASIYWLGNPPGDSTRFRAPGFSFWLVTVFIALLIVSLAALRHRMQPLWIQGVGAFSLVAVLVGYGVGLSWHQAYREASVRYFPEEIGFAAVIDRMSRLLDDEERFLAPKDIGSATTNRYYQEEQLFPSLELLSERLQDPTLRYAVVRRTWDYSYQVFPEVEPLIEEYMDVQETIGDFIIYKRAQ